MYYAAQYELVLKAAKEVSLIHRLCNVIQSPCGSWKGVVQALCAALLHHEHELPGQQKGGIASLAPCPGVASLAH